MQRSNEKWSENDAKATPEGITYTESRSRFVPDLDRVVKALLTNENWNRATAALSEGQSLDTTARDLFECRQEDITYDNAAAHYAYLLQYMPSYASEYVLMYWDIADLLADRLWDEGVSVCSIGAGNLMDYWSFARVFANWGNQHMDAIGVKYELGKFMKKLSYLGIERAPWSYPFAFLNCHKEACKACYGMDIASAEAAAAVAEANPLVYVFPKSLNELDDDAIKAVSQIIASSTHPQVYVAISLPAKKMDDGSFTTDGGAWKITKLRDALHAEGCTLTEPPVRQHEAGTSLTTDQRKVYSHAFSGTIKPIKEKCEATNHPEIEPASKHGRLNWQIFSCTCPQDA